MIAILLIVIICLLGGGPILLALLGIFALITVVTLILCWLSDILGGGK